MDTTTESAKRLARAALRRGTDPATLIETVAILSLAVVSLDAGSEPVGPDFAWIRDALTTPEV